MMRRTWTGKWTFHCSHEPLHKDDGMIIVSCFRVTEQLAPFTRQIQPEEIWLYRFHHVKNDHVPTSLMFVSVCCLTAIYKH